jgi:riboflavin kinase / FMN adenylyltransferase
MIIARSARDLPGYGLHRAGFAIGIFDGVHRGHQAIMAELRARCEAVGAAAVAYTFDPHPRAVLSPDGAPDLIVSPMHKLALLERLGLDATVVLPFNRALAATEPAEFVRRELLPAGLEVPVLCVGQTWRFGRGAAGTVDLLHRLGAEHGFTAVGVPLVPDAGGPVSSSRIREALATGDLPLAERLLGRPFSIRGRVALGKGIATTELRYPTANVTPGNDCFPPVGIYAATAWLDEPAGRRRLPGVLYLGYSPTFVADAPPKPFVEMHIFDFHEDIYGRDLEVDFNHPIRPDARFAGASDLAAQIALDVQAARHWHTTHPA